MYIALGSNLGDRGANLRGALQHIEVHARVRATSSIYETDPVGYTEQPRFWNMVALATTRLAPEQLLEQLLEIEQRMGRERSFRNAPRVIDLDILLFGDVVLDMPGLTLPHPRMRERAFVLQPLLEVAPDLKDPITGEWYRDVWQRAGFEPAAVVQRFEEQKS